MTQQSEPKAPVVLVSSYRLWAANANGNYGWVLKHTFSDGSVKWGPLKPEPTS